MNYYGAKELANSFRTVRKNTIQTAEDIPKDSTDSPLPKGPGASPEPWSISPCLRSSILKSTRVNAERVSKDSISRR